MIKAVLFDMDGILFDSEKHYMAGTIEQMKAYGYRGDIKDIYRIIGTSMKETYEILYELLDRKVELDTIIKNNEKYFLEDHPLDYKELMFDGVEEVVKELKDKEIRLAVCSSSPKETILEALSEMGIKDYFEVVISSDEVSKSKPEPDVYLKAVELLEIEKEDCIVYEDSRLGVEAGINAGIYTIGRRDDRFYQDISEADYIVNDIYELREWIRKENGYA